MQMYCYEKLLWRYYYSILTQIEWKSIVIVKDRRFHLVFSFLTDKNLQIIRISKTLYEFQTKFYALHS